MTAANNSSQTNRRDVECSCHDGKFKHNITGLARTVCYLEDARQQNHETKPN